MGGREGGNEERGGEEIKTKKGRREEPGRKNILKGMRERKEWMKEKKE